jgi:c-di-GMP-binding flagellar brake protein YcgR
MGVMTERRKARRYDLTLAISIRFPEERILARRDGKTIDISTRGVYFVIDKDLDVGSELNMTLTLPAEITHGTDVHVSMHGKVVRVERRVEEGEPRLGVAAAIERYDIIRGEAGRPRALPVKLNRA